MSFGTNSPFGLKPSRFLTGAEWNGATNTYTVDTTTGSLFTGDPVKMTANGVIQPCAAADTSVGVFMGCYYESSVTLANSPYYFPAWVNGTAIKAGTLVTAYVVDDPSVIYEVQTNAAGALVAANVGNTVNWATGAGNATTGQSGYVLDQASLGTAATLNMKILRLADTPANAWGLAFNVVEVLINTHFYRGGVAGI